MAAATGAIVMAANASSSAYFSQSWGWVALAFLVPAALALVLGVAQRPKRLRAAFALVVVALGAWIAASTAWSLTPSGSAREAERMLVYAGLAIALALVVRRGDATGIVAGAVAGIVAISSYGLATRLFPDRLDTVVDPSLPYRLSEPVGYWNSLGLLAGLGVILGIGVVAQGRRTVYRAGVAAAFPLLAATLYFTFSRGAWVATALGFAAALALDGRRLRLLVATSVVAPPSALAVLLASRQDALTREDALLRDRIAQGERLAMWLVVLGVLCGTVTGVAAYLTRRVRVPRWVLRTVNAVLASALILVVAVGAVRVGHPSDALADLRERFDAPLAVRDPDDLNARLFNASGNGRAESIGVAWEAARERPVLGHGAGSYEILWYERRESQLVIRDAHSLYAEMLAEIGAVGLGLLVLALLVPLVAALRARRARLVPVATGAYLAWIVHSSLDWHWEMVGVTMTSLALAGVALVSAERGGRARLGARTSGALIAALAVLSVASVVSLVGNQALFAGRAAVRDARPGDALDHARRAEALLFWSHEPAIVVGDARARLGDRDGALVKYRSAVDADPRNWVAWLLRAQVASGSERRASYRRVRELNPQARDLPGEDEQSR